MVYPLTSMRIAAALIAIAALLAVPGFAGTEPETAAAAKTAIRLGDNFFKPARKAVRRGTLVRFRWIGRNRHNVTKRRGPGRRFKSRTTRRRGVNFSKRFRKRGTYRLICTIHPTEMRLKLRVR